MGTGFNKRLWLIVALILSVVLGYVSNWVSEDVCVKRTAIWLTDVEMGGRSFYVRMDGNEGNSPRIFSSINAKYQKYVPTSLYDTKSPWARIGPTFAYIPFLTSVRYEYFMGGFFTDKNGKLQYGPTGGAGGYLLYITFMGFVLEIDDHVDLSLG